MDAAAETGRNPVSKHHIQPEYGDEQADAGRDCRTRLARPNSQARTQTEGNIVFPCCSADHMQDWQPCPVINTLAICVTITCIYVRLTRYVCMYICMVITYSKGKDQPGKVDNPAGGQLAEQGR